jgi:hypothetical protein
MADEATEEFFTWVESLAPYEHELVLLRALNKIGWSYEIDADGVDFEGDENAPELQRAVHEEYNRMHIKEIISQLVSEGLIVGATVFDDGEIGYLATQGNNGP